MITYLKYVLHHELLYHMAKGWEVRDDLSGTNHGAYSFLMIFRGEGEPE